MRPATQSEILTGKTLATDRIGVTDFRGWPERSARQVQDQSNVIRVTAFSHADMSASGRMRQFALNAPSPYPFFLARI